MKMLENVSSMMCKVTTKESPTATAGTSSKARQITEILTSKTSQLTTAKLALPLERQTPTTSSLPASTQESSTPAQSALLNSTTRTSFNSLTTKDTTLPTSSLSYLSLLATTTSKTDVATFSSASAVTNLKFKQTITNLSPAFLLTNLTAAIATNVKPSISTSNTNYSSWTNSKSSQPAIATNRKVSPYKFQQNDTNEIYHMLSLNNQNYKNGFQQEKHYQQQKQQQQNKPQRHCCNKPLQQQQQKIKQFLLLLTCFVAIITIFSLPHLSTATALHMATTHAPPATTITKTTQKTIKSLAITNTTTHYKLKQFSSSSAHSSRTYDSLTDNESKDDDNSYINKIADNSDDLTYFSPLPAAIENSLRNFRPSSRQSFLQNHINTRLIRSLDVSGNSGGGSGGSISSVFSTSPGGSASLTNIFNQNLDSGLSNSIECPSFDESSACPCYKFEDGLFLECPGTTATSLRSTLERVSSPIHSLSIYDFDRSVTSLSQDVFQPGVNIRHLQFSHSHLETLKENSLKNVRLSLESLSIVNGKLTQDISDVCESLL